MNVDASLLLQLLSPVAAAVGVYAGIRVDLARLNERTSALQRDSDRLMSRCFGAASCGGKS